MPLVTARVDRPLAAFGDRRFRTIVWLALAVVGWAGIAVLGAALQANGELGFDLELVLEAGRRAAVGASPYDPAVIAGASLEAQDLFYSYPPPLAQAAALVAGLPSTLALLAFGVLAVATFGVVATRISARLAPGISPASALVPILAILPFLYPMTVALLFGNVDAWYPALYGAALVAALPGASRGELVVGGVALALASAAKLHPASIGVWFLLRAVRHAGLGLALGSAIVAGGVVLGLSLALGGLDPWRDYLAVIRTISGAEIVLRNNIAPAAQLAGVLGAGEAGARLLQLPVAVLALGATALAALRLRDTTFSLAVAAAASLVILPVTWYHYPAAMLPFAVAAWAGGRSRPEGGRIAATLAAAAIVAAVSIALPATVWISVALVLVATRVSAGEP